MPNIAQDSDTRTVAEKYFSQCFLEPVVASEIETSKIVQAKLEDDEDVTASLEESDRRHHEEYDGKVFSTTSFFLDSSGRSKMNLPLKLTFPSQEALDHFLIQDCIHPVPQNIVKKEDDDQDIEEQTNLDDSAADANSKKTALGFEVTTVAVAAADTLTEMDNSMVSIKSAYSSMQSTCANEPLLQQHRAIVEGIAVTSSRIDGLSVYFDAEVIVRAAQMNYLVLKTRLHVVAVLSEQPRNPPTQQSRMSYEGFPDFTLQTTLTASKVKHARLDPFLLEVTLTDALAIDVTSIPGPTTGRTFVSLVLRHPNTHNEPVIVTNIAMHPGHSRLELPAPPGANQATHSVVVDMSQCVQWGYAPQTQPKLPMKLNPHCAYSTILTVDAMEHMRSRTFKSPVSVTAVVGHTANSLDEKESKDTAQSPTTVSSADAQWTTGRLAQEPTDAFRIEMQLQNKDFYVGEPFTLFLRVKNLSADARDMMLLVAKDSDKQSGVVACGHKGNRTTTRSSAPGAAALAIPTGNNLNVSSHHSAAGDRFNATKQKKQQQRSNVPNTAVVSEVNGYTFGVWGLVADKDNPVFHLDRDQDLLAIDAALLLGEIKGHHSVEAELRFNPLREGTLAVPNMQLFDKRNRKWYYCTHKLNIVARQRDESEKPSSQ